MALIKRYRKESLGDDNVATFYLKTYFLGIPIYEEKFDSTSNTALSQFIDFNIEQEQSNNLYKSNNIGFKS